MLQPEPTSERDKALTNPPATMKEKECLGTFGGITEAHGAHDLTYLPPSGGCKGSLSTDSKGLHACKLLWTVYAKM